MLRLVAWCPLVLVVTAVAASAQALPMTPEAKIQNALSAAPAYIAQGAAVWDWPAEGQTQAPVLRGGSNGWTCLPTHPEDLANAPMCMDEAMREFRVALWRGEEPTLDRIAVRYMLQGGPGVDSQGRQTLGPHIMISIPAGLGLADWIADAQRPNGPFVSSEINGTVITIPVAAAGGSTR